MSERSDLDVFRIFHGDAEGAPGVAIDRFGDVVVIHAESGASLDALVPSIREALSGFGTAYAKVHPHGVSHLSGEERSRFAPTTPVWGPPLESVSVTEFGARYVVRPASGLSVGLFIDMREVRQWLRSSCAGYRVLNLFAYTCSLGVCAALGGAERVVNVDVSRSYLEWGKANYFSNALAVDDRDFIYGDAFDWLRRFARRGERFDMVILDPPSFSSTPFSVTRDYARLVSAASHVLVPGGVLLAATNHAATSDARFEAWLGAGLAAASRAGSLVQRWHEPSVDFPIAPGGKPYLKVRALSLD